MNESQDKLNACLAKSLLDMYNKREEKPTYKTGVCCQCSNRFDVELLIIPFWYSTRARLCPECYTRVLNKR